MYIFMSGTILVTICGNLIVIIAISHFRQLHSPTNFLILSLACVDFLLGVLVMPHSMVRSVETCWYFGDFVCKIHSSCDMMMSMASISHLCFISIDRYYAVCDPLHYQTKITTLVVSLFIAFSWLYAMCFAFGVVFSNVQLVGIEDFILSSSCVGNCGLIFNKQWGVLVTIFAIVIPGTIMIFLYIKIFLVAKRHIRILNKMPGSKVTQEEKKKQKFQETENKAAKTLGIVMGVFLVCWSPFFIATIIDPFVGFTTPPVLFDALVWLGYFNSTFNPIIYGFFYPWFQKALKIILTGRIFTRGSDTITLFPE
ncbi:trace amine-associated receptor 4-like [Erpetoichthys calabaricus]|uniref:trace amine-associated receptor 4-like n=1 Tax=Erpetoichthys calabaricus TaxID=27687 RepID=UPI0022345EEF|nr:trace amine-associated receptor 4-like [Erpetoichthys calabaricus]